MSGERRYEPRHAGRPELGVSPLDVVRAEARQYRESARTVDMGLRPGDGCRSWRSRQPARMGRVGRPVTSPLTPDVLNHLRLGVLLARRNGEPTVPVPVDLLDALLACAGGAE